MFVCERWNCFIKLRGGAETMAFLFIYFFFLVTFEFVLFFFLYNILCNTVFFSYYYFFLLPVMRIRCLLLSPHVNVGAASGNSTRNFTSRCFFMDRFDRANFVKFAPCWAAFLKSENSFVFFS